MTAPQTHEGGCLCGRVRYRVDGPLEPGAHCHCTQCRRGAGAPVVTWHSASVDRFAFTKGVPAAYTSSDHATRSFCRDCGTQLTFFSTRSPDDLDITLGSLDHPEDHPADRHIHVTSRLPWLKLDPHLPDHEAETPPPVGGGDARPSTGSG